ncbi:MAG: bifunctional acetate--CoA ligase family protein/GNAT family N-acetyltransferase [Hyphomicrobiaceae bacterium]|nr:bifunctional acetate--CoA ligase family protein/GNAT family N-acetyltransferase [Hyphomicrobiaceae bacterium]
MTIRNLEAAFAPGSVAIIGASERPGTVGSVLVRAMLEAGFEGPLHLVNPRHRTLHGLPVHADVAAMPSPVDLAVVVTPPRTVPGIIADLGARGTKAAIVITAGFGEGGREEGERLRQQMLDAAKPHLLRIFGPNCLGIIVPAAKVNASFAGISPPAGRIAFVTQSGAIVTAVLDWARGRGIGFSHMVTLGGMADVDFGDMLDYLGRDPKVGAILLYVEAVTNARKFMSAARAAARAKPVIVVKGGRFAEGARAVASHTGALAGSDAVYDAAFRRAGMLRVYSLGELFDAVETLSKIGLPAGERVAILTNGGGAGVLATDALIEQGGHLATLSPDTMSRLDAALPPTWSRGNPVDVIGDAGAERYTAALSALLEDPGIDAIMVINCPTALIDGATVATAISEVIGRHPTGKTVITNWLGGASTKQPRQILTGRGIPTFETPYETARAFMHLVTYRRNQALLAMTPPSIPTDFQPDTAAVRKIIAAVLREGREILSEIEAKAVLEAYQIPTTRTRVARTPAEAATIAAEIGCPVAIKILSHEITHKSDVGGVALDLATPAAAEAATAEMLERIAKARPEARIEGVTVQEMIRRPRAFELIVGMSVAHEFGPVIMFGQGGTGVEIIADTAMALPPLDMNLARHLMRQTRIHRLLQGYRDRPAVALDDIALTLIKVAQLAIDVAEVVELDINPLIADERGVLALDARIRVTPARGPSGQRLAIMPYPSEHEEDVELADGTRLFLRPIRAEDEPQLLAGFSRLSQAEVRQRFLVPMKVLDHLLAARLTQINYDRELALVLTHRGTPGTTEIHAVARYSADPDLESAEFAIIVRREISGRGIGRLMMDRLIAAARARGIASFVGDVLTENARMLNLCRDLGFARAYDPTNPGVVRVTLKL